MVATASAETIEVPARAFLATKLSFVNAVAAMSKRVGADVNDIVLGMELRQTHRSRVPEAQAGWAAIASPRTHALLYIAQEAV